MVDYINELCACGMRVDDAYTVVNDFFRELDIDGLEDYILQYKAVRETLAAYVD